MAPCMRSGPRAQGIFPGGISHVSPFPEDSIEGGCWGVDPLLDNLVHHTVPGQVNIPASDLFIGMNLSCFVRATSFDNERATRYPSNPIAFPKVQLPTEWFDYFFMSDGPLWLFQLDHGWDHGEEPLRSTVTDRSFKPRPMSRNGCIRQCHPYFRKIFKPRTVGRQFPHPPNAIRPTLSSIPRYLLTIS